MKKISLILAVAIGVFAFFISCEKEDKVVLDMDKTIAPELLSPEGGGTYVLLKANAGEIFEKFEWTAAEYDLKDMPDIRYIIQVDFADSLFKNPRIVANTDTLFEEVAVQTVNQRLLALGATPEEAHVFAFRVFSYLSIDSEYNYAYSDAIELTITPYAEFIGVKPIYLLGGGTPAGWNNSAALEMTHVEEGSFEIVSELGGGDNLLKFISILGEWEPMWGTTGENDYTIEDGVQKGDLVYRPVGADDPPAIKLHLDPGEFRIVADTLNLRYQLIPYDTED